MKYEAGEGQSNIHSKCEISPNEEGLSVLNVHEIAPGFDVRVFHPATTIEALTIPRLYRYSADCYGLNVNFVAGIGPKSTKGRLTADDFYFLHGSFPTHKSCVNFLIVEQYDGLNSGDPVYFRNSLLKVLNEPKYTPAYLSHVVKLPSLLVDAESLFNYADGSLRESVDADNFAVMIQREFYRKFGELNRQWLGNFTEKLAETLEDDVPQHYRDTRVRELVWAAMGVFSQVRAKFSLECTRSLRDAFDNFSSIVHGMKFDEIRPVWREIWGDSIYTTGLSLAYRSGSETRVTTCLLRSLADSFIVTIYNDEHNRRATQCMVADVNHPVTLVSKLNSAIASGTEINDVYKRLVHGSAKPGGFYSTRNSWFRECMAYGDANLFELGTTHISPLTEILVRTYVLRGESSLDFYHLSDGACFSQRSAATRYKMDPDTLERVTLEFGSNPDAFLNTMVSSPKDDDWVIARLSLSSNSD